MSIHGEMKLGEVTMAAMRALKKSQPASIGCFSSAADCRGAAEALLEHLGAKGLASQDAYGGWSLTIVGDWELALRERGLV